MHTRLFNLYLSMESVTFKWGYIFIYSRHFAVLDKLTLALNMSDQ